MALSASLAFASGLVDGSLLHRLGLALAVTLAVAGVTAAAFLSLLLPGGGYPAAIGGVLALSAVVYGLYRIFSSRRPGNQKRLYRRLLKLARGDQDLAERMIENERRRSPAAGREELMQDAIYRWERDL